MRFVLSTIVFDRTGKTNKGEKSGSVPKLFVAATASTLGALASSLGTIGEKFLSMFAAIVVFVVVWLIVLPRPVLVVAAPRSDSAFRPI